MPPAHQGGGKWSEIPTASDIRSICTAKVYESGRRSYEAGNVTEARVGRDTVSASVYDDEDGRVHDVDIDSERGHRLYTDCTCYTSYVYGSICRHVVAVLLHISDDPVDVDLYGGVTEETVSSLLERTPPERAASFLAKIMADDTRVLHRFITENGLGSEYAISRFEGGLAAMYGRADREGGKITQGLDFGEQFGEARRTRTEGRHADAARMYRAISEAISGRMDVVADGSGYYADCFIEALEGMVECILRERPPHDRKRGYISYLFGRAASARGAGFSRHYREALESVCSTDADLGFWQEIIGTPAEDCGRDELAEMLRMQAHILGRQGRHADIVGLLGRHYSLHSDICVLYLQALLRQQQRRRGRQAAAGGGGGGDAARAVEAFPDDPEVLEAAYAAMPEKGADGARVLERLYSITGDWNHVVRLKHVLPDWSGARAGIIGRLARTSPGNAVGLCIREDMPDKAMDVLEAASDMELLESYGAKMIRRRPRRYAACYANLLLKFAGSRSGREHYSRVRNRLTALKGMPGGDAHYGSVLGLIRKKYAGRRALIKELSGL